MNPMRTTLAVLIFAMVQVAAVAAENDPEGVKFSLRDGLLVDDNLYRAADGGESDTINRLSAGVDGAWQLSRQGLNVTARLDRNRFRRNDQLDYTSGNASASWAWQAGSTLSGDLGVDYNRALASFANTTFRS